MVKTIIGSILLSFVLAGGCVVDMLSYHEPKALEPLRRDLFGTASLQVQAANDVFRHGEVSMPR